MLQRHVALCQWRTRQTAGVTSQVLAVGSRKQWIRRTFADQQGNDDGDSNNGGNGDDSAPASTESSGATSASTAGKGRSSSVESIYKLFSEVLERDRKKPPQDGEDASRGGSGSGLRGVRGAARLPDIKPAIPEHSQRASEVFGKLRAWSDTSSKQLGSRFYRQLTRKEREERNILENLAGGHIGTEHAGAYYRPPESILSDTEDEDQFGNVKITVPKLGNTEMQRVMEDRMLRAQARKYAAYSLPHKFMQSTDIPLERPDGDPMVYYDPTHNPGSRITPNRHEDLDLEAVPRDGPVPGVEDPLSDKPQLAYLQEQRERDERMLDWCPFCAETLPPLDYKNAFLLSLFVDVAGNIGPKYQTGLCSKHQRKLNKTIKKARQMAVLPYDTKLTEYRQQSEIKHLPSDDLRRMKNKDFVIRYPVPRDDAADAQRLSEIVKRIQAGDAWRAQSLEKHQEAKEARQEGKPLFEQEMEALDARIAEDPLAEITDVHTFDSVLEEQEQGPRMRDPREASPEELRAILTPEEMEEITRPTQVTSPGPGEPAPPELFDSDFESDFDEKNRRTQEDAIIQRDDDPIEHYLKVRYAGEKVPNWVRAEVRKEQIWRERKSRR